MATERFTVRAARPDDADALIGMMRALAAFEGYLPRFRVTAADLRVRAFGPGAQCGILVAQARDGSVGGSAVNDRTMTMVPVMVRTVMVVSFVMIV